MIRGTEISQGKEGIDQFGEADAMSDRKGRGHVRHTCVKALVTHWHASHLYMGITGGQIAVLCDQVNDLFHYDIVVVILEFRHRFNEAANTGVDVRLE